MDEQGWQPVRIGKYIKHGLCNFAELPRERTDYCGRIVRVRPSESSNFLCTGRTFACHPEDALIVMGYSGPFNLMFCEHQILAD